MISFESYSKIANNYCVCYFGNSDEYLVQLKLLKPIIEKEFQDLNVYIGCKDEKLDLLEGCNQTLKLTELKIRKNNFAYISELRCNGSTHPIEDFLIGAKIANFAIQPQDQQKTQRCVIVTKSSFPTNPLERAKIEKLKSMATSNGMYCELDSDIKGAGMVVGVESVQICQAAARGIETILIPTGVGTRLYRSLFPKLKLMDI